MFKKIIFIFSFVCFFYTVSIAQNQSDVALDSLVILMANVQDEANTTPLSETHPEFKEPRVDIEISFKITHVENLKSVEIFFEREHGKKDFKLIQLTYVNTGGKQYLTVGTQVYPITNGKAVIRNQVNAALMKHKIYFGIQATDTKNRFSNTLKKEFN